MTTIAQVPTPADLCLLVNAVWSAFLDGDRHPVELALAGDGEHLPSHAEVIALVSITGAWRGHLLLTLSASGALATAQAMFGVEHDHVSTEDLADAVGELGNILAGNIKAMLPQPSVLSLPHVVFDPNNFSLPSTRLRAGAAMTWNEHPVAVSLWEAHADDKGASPCV